jgi:glycosyltransferase involved in cell wall biosynthesis
LQRLPSEFNKRSFTNGGVHSKLLKVVPLSYNSHRFREENIIIPLSNFRHPDKNYTFTSIFKWEDRKAPEILFKAYLEEFSWKDNVCLIVSTHNSPVTTNKMEDQINEIVNWNNNVAKMPVEKRKDFPCLRVFDKYLTNDEIVSFHKSGNVTVLPTRGEGWGLPFMQSMALGVPAIGTRWGGNTAFMNDSNSYMLNYKELKQRHQLQGKTAEPDVQHLKQLMRYAYNNPEEVQKKGRIAKEYVVHTFSREAIRDLVFTELKRIENLLLSDKN